MNVALRECDHNVVFGKQLRDSEAQVAADITQELLSAIQKMQQLSRKEGDRISIFDKESDRLLGLYGKLREEIVKLSPSAEDGD